MHVLVVEDDQMIVDSFEAILRKEGISYEISYNANDGLALLKEQIFDVILLDLMLPYIDGYTALSKIRALEIDTPVIIVSAKEGVENKVDGLKLGADDYLQKPFYPEELIARIEALVRRYRKDGFHNTIELPHHIEIHCEKRIATAKGSAMALSKREYRLLELLAKKRGGIVSKTACMDALYDGMDEPFEEAIEQHMSRLRKKIKDITGQQNLITTVYGEGYIIH